MKPIARRFNLGDLMILIAALGVTMMTLRSLWQGLATTSYWSVTPSRLLVAAVLSAFATPLTLACLAFRLREPRPLWRRIALRPGTVAILTATVIIAFQAVEVGLSLALPKVAFFTNTRASSIPFGESLSLVVMRTVRINDAIAYLEPMGCFGMLTVSVAAPSGPAVAAVWLVLALSGRWLAEKSWIDRLGRGLGASWLLISLLAAFPVT